MNKDNYQSKTNPHKKQRVDKKWNVVITKTIAGTVSQEKINQLRKSITNNPEIRAGIWRG